MLWLTALETVIVGVLDTLVGIAGGDAVLSWMAATTIADVMGRGRAEDP